MRPLVEVSQFGQGLVVLIETSALFEIRDCKVIDRAQLLERKGPNDTCHQLRLVGDLPLLLAKDCVIAHRHRLASFSFLTRPTDFVVLGV